MKKVAREFLTQAELDRIEVKVFKIERLALIRDLFVFSCYTGLAYGDLMKLTPKQVVKNGDETWIRTAREKTLEPVSLPLLSKAIFILNTYAGIERAQYNGTVFPVISNQKVNSYLKEIAEICEVHKNLTFHMARHTFATTVTLSNGVPIETVDAMYTTFACALLAVLLLGSWLFYFRLRKRSRSNSEDYKRLFDGIPTPMYIEISALLKFHENLPEGHFNAGRWLHRNRSGQQFYVSVYTHHTIFEGKGARQVLIVNIDEKMRAEQILSEKSAELENMLDSITDGFYALNSRWEVTFINKAAEILHYWPAWRPNPVKSSKSLTF